VKNSTQHIISIINITGVEEGVETKEVEAEVVAVVVVVVEEEGVEEEEEGATNANLYAI